MSGLVGIGGGLMAVKLWRIEQDLWCQAGQGWQQILIYGVNLLTFSMFLISDKFV